MFATLALAALAGNFALATGVSTAIAAIAVALAAILLLVEAGPNANQLVVRLSAGIAITAGLLLPLRASTWLASLNSAAAASALVVLALAASGMRFAVSTSTLGQAIWRLFDAVYGPRLIARSVALPRRGSFAHALPVVRGLLLAAIPVLVLVTLLASADAVFAAAITPDISTGAVPAHAMRTIFVALVLAGLVAIGATPVTERSGELRPIGAIEALVLLGSIATLFGAFALVQLASALGQTDAILANEGVSHADYARNGYFQLLWVAAITAALLISIAALKRSGSTRVERAHQIVSSLVALLTCVIVASAIVRLDLYTDAFGQTTLRWYSNAFAWMLGVGFVLVAAAGMRATARWLPVSIVSLTAATLLVVNVLNAEARIAEHNLERVGAATELDADYLIGLSADAWPVILEHRDDVIANLGPDWSGQRPRDRFRNACERAAEPFGFGPAGFNVAIARLDC